MLNATKRIAVSMSKKNEFYNEGKEQTKAVSSTRKNPFEVVDSETVTFLHFDLWSYPGI